MDRRNNSELRRRKAKKKKEQTRKAARSEAQGKTHRHEFLKLLEWLLPAECTFASLKRHGNTKWWFQTLVFLALCWAWAENKGAVDSFTYGSEWCRTLSEGTVLSTYQGMMNALERWTDPMMNILWKVLHQRMKQVGGQFWRTGGWVPIAFDGSRDSAPRTESNEAAFCAANHGHGTTAKYRKKRTKGMRRSNNEKNKSAAPRPQVWITMMWHMGLRLPWTWQLGPSNACERADVMNMVEGGDFPENTLFCGDAGFVGYPLWSVIRNRGHHFLVRVGANVNLLTERGDCLLKKNMLVLSWPQDAIKAGLAPLKLRLVKVRIGKTWMWLLTSVLDKDKLSIKAIRELYKQRWGIEVEFRGLKQTLDKGELRCRTAARVKVELHWSLMAMAVAELFALKEQLQRSRAASPPSKSDPHPQKRSLVETVRAMRWSLTHLRQVPASDEEILPARLRNAQTDSYQRTAAKAARYRPPNPDKKPLGQPKIRRLSPVEQSKLKAIKSNALTG